MVWWTRCSSLRAVVTLRWQMQTSNGNGTRIARNGDSDDSILPQEMK